MHDRAWGRRVARAFEAGVQRPIGVEVAALAVGVGVPLLCGFEVLSLAHFGTSGARTAWELAEDYARLGFALALVVAIPVFFAVTLWRGVDAIRRWTVNACLVGAGFVLLAFGAFEWNTALELRWNLSITPRDVVADGLLALTLAVAWLLTRRETRVWFGTREFVRRKTAIAAEPLSIEDRRERLAMIERATANPPPRPRCVAVITIVSTLAGIAAAIALGLQYADRFAAPHGDFQSLMEHSGLLTLLFYAYFGWCRSLWLGRDAARQAATSLAIFAGLGTVCVAIVIAIAVVIGGTNEKRGNGPLASWTVAFAIPFASLTLFNYMSRDDVVFWFAVRGRLLERRREERRA